METRLVFATLSIHARSSNNLRSQQRVQLQSFVPTTCTLGRVRRQGQHVRAWEVLQKRNASTNAAQAARKQTYVGVVTRPSPSLSARGDESERASAQPHLAKISSPPNDALHSDVVSSKKPPAPPATVPVKAPMPTKPVTPVAIATARLNPPSFTYAPPLDVPAKKANQGMASYLWNAGRAYLGFYKSGIANVRQTSKVAKELRAKVASVHGHDMSEVLTRAEWQVVRRSRRDVLRLPAMGALLLIFGEWLPLIIIYLTPATPETCRIPQQVQRAIRKLEEKRAERLRRVSLDAHRFMLKDRRPVGAAMDVKLSDLQDSESISLSGGAMRSLNAEKMTLFELLLFSAKHDCHARVWDWLFITPPKWLLRRNVGRTLKYLQKDNELIDRDGGWAALSAEEIQRACMERGINVRERKEDEQRRALAKTVAGGEV